MFLDVELQKIFTRLGFKKSKTLITKEQIKDIIKIKDIAESTFKPQTIFKRFSNHPPKWATDLHVDTSHNHNVKELFLNPVVVFVGVTLGDEIDELIEQAIKKGELYNASILDATASVCVNSLMSSFLAKIKQDIRNEGLLLSKFRISPGQLGVPLEAQLKMHQLLELEKLGIKINEHKMLIPQKSVIAITSATT